MCGRAKSALEARALAWDMSFPYMLRLGTAAAILLVGTFVLVARPRSLVHRAFFLFALVDGMSTGLFALRNMAEDPATKAYFMGTYYYFFVAFTTVLLAFGLLYPRPLGGERWGRRILGTTVGLALLTLVAYAVRHDWFWIERQNGSFARVNVGILIEVLFPVAIAAAALKLMWDTLRAPTPLMRNQSAIVLAGMLIGFGTVNAAQTIDAMSNPARTFGSVEPLWRLWAWSVTACSLLLIALAVALVRGRRGMEQFSRRTLLVTYLTSVAFVVVAVAASAPTTTGTTSIGYELTKGLGLLAYPVLLAIAIFRAEAFEINPQLRRATVLTLAGATIATTFVLLENFLQGFLEASLLAGLGSDLIVGILSALVAAAIIIPLLGVARRVATRFLPVDAEHVHNLATYRLVLEGALEDGLLDARESRTLDALRRALAVSEREHEEILQGVRDARARATAAPPGDHQDGVEAGPSF